MDNVIEQLFLESQRLSDVNQEWEYEEFERLVEIRQSIADQIDSLSDQQRARLRQLQQFDDKIVTNMQRLMQEAQDGISRLNSSRKQKNAYSHADNLGSFMFDEKK